MASSVHTLLTVGNNAAVNAGCCIKCVFIFYIIQKLGMEVNSRNPSIEDVVGGF